MSQQEIEAANAGDSAVISDDDSNDENFQDVRSTCDRQSIPVVCWKEGLALKKPMSVDSWVLLAQTLDGRDKITKVFQYAARFLAWWLQGRSQQAQRFQSLKASLTTSRKAFRLGRTLIECQKLNRMGAFAILMWYIRDRARLPSQRDGEEDARKGTAWKIVGSALKTLGLLGFWAGDNVNFLASSGLFDNLRLSTPARLEMRKSLQTRASRFANRAYFFGAVAGLILNARLYLEHRREKLQRMEDDDQETVDEAKGKEFFLFVALLKSCCDALVFSNNPGIDFWKNVVGRKFHEGVHCLAGFTSASTVLYNKFPDA